MTKTKTQIQRLEKDLEIVKINRNKLIELREELKEEDKTRLTGAYMNFLNDKEKELTDNIFKLIKIGEGID